MKFSTRLKKLAACTALVAAGLLAGGTAAEAAEKVQDLPQHELHRQ